MMESEVPATGSVKQQAASKTAPQRVRLRRGKELLRNSPGAKKKEKNRSQLANQQQTWQWHPANQRRKKVGEDREVRGGQSEDCVRLIEVRIRQLLDAGYVYGPVVRQRMVAVDQKHCRRKQCNHPPFGFGFDHYCRW